MEYNIHKPWRPPLPLDPGVYFLPYGTYARFRSGGGYGEIQGTQLDTARYVRIQLDTVGYSGSTAEWLDTGIQRDTKDTVRYRQDTGKIKIQAGDSKNTIHAKVAAKGKGGLNTIAYTYRIYRGINSYSIDELYIYIIYI